MKFVLKFSLALILLLPFLLFLTGLAYQFSGYSLFAGKPYSGLGITPEGGLDNCPNKPVSTIRKQENCVSSQDDGESEYFAKPISYDGNRSQAMAKIYDLMQQNIHWKLVSQEGDYFHIEVYSSFFGFVDDLEILLGEQEIYFRSSARLGFKDLAPTVFTSPG